MPKYKVTGTQMLQVEVEVEADNEEEAENSVDNWFDSFKHIVWSDEIDVDTVELIDEE